MESTDSWAIYLDIEGMSRRLEKGAINDFVKLTEDLYEIGKSFDNLSITQFGGDGFLIKQLFVYKSCINIPVEIAAAILKASIAKGFMCKAKIACGNLFDISLLYNEEIKNSLAENSNILRKEKNIMTITPLIGSSIINAHNLKTPSGPTLSIRKELIANLVIAPQLLRESDNSIEINWLKFNSDRISKILDQLGCNDIELIESNFIRYIEENCDDTTWSKREDWKKGADWMR